MKQNTKKRCILLFPKFKNSRFIDAIREKYDPSSDNVPPHVTLVFPFESELSCAEMMKHVVAAIENTEPFDLAMQKVHKLVAPEFYLVLGVAQGKDAIKALHEALYSGILAPYKPVWQNGFVPHMTIGLLHNIEELNNAYDNANSGELFCARIDTISVEIIGAHDESIIEFEVKLED